MWALLDTEGEGRIRGTSGLWSWLDDGVFHMKRTRRKLNLSFCCWEERLSVRLLQSRKFRNEHLKSETVHRSGECWVCNDRHIWAQKSGLHWRCTFGSIRKSPPYPSLPQRESTDWEEKQVQDWVFRNVNSETSVIRSSAQMGSSGRRTVVIRIRKAKGPYK